MAIYFCIHIMFKAADILDTCHSITNSMQSLILIDWEDFYLLFISRAKYVNDFLFWKWGWEGSSSWILKFTIIVNIRQTEKQVSWWIIFSRNVRPEIKMLIVEWQMWSCSSPMICFHIFWYAFFFFTQIELHIIRNFTSVFSNKLICKTSVDFSVRSPWNPLKIFLYFWVVSHSNKMLDLMQKFWCNDNLKNIKFILNNFWLIVYFSSY